MGPQQRCCGIEKGMHVVVAEVGGFNGAAAALLRNSLTGGDGSTLTGGLQWGRSSAAAELHALCHLLSPHNRFHGAAAALPRNCVLCFICVLPKYVSMGPKERSSGIKGREGEGKGGEGAS